ncbi:hypothetical protein BAMY6639_10710 [Bacillus amyloliquefaciens UMAF6639]|nr:hypothetical protein BAMY6639_10710 [Bacillus amyloliquefaciens UMAF6639]
MTTGQHVKQTSIYASRKPITRFHENHLNNDRFSLDFINSDLLNGTVEEYTLS